jgi:hypothetical protein
MSEENFCQEYARIECKDVADFCGFNASACEPARVAECRQRRGGPGANRQFNANNADACLKKLDQTYKLPLILGADLQALELTCARVFAGTGKLLDMCQADLDCAEGIICDKSRCSPLKIVASRGLCGNPGERCPGGEYCTNATGVFQCVPRIPQDAACALTMPCLESLRCGAAAGRCLARLETGEVCGGDDECKSGYCTRYVSNPTCSRGLNFSPGSDSCDHYLGGGDAGVAPAGPDAGTD